MNKKYLLSTTALVVVGALSFGTAGTTPLAANDVYKAPDTTKVIHIGDHDDHDHPLAQDGKKDSDKDAKGEDGDKKKGLPLKAERKISFETDEGTWMSLDVSPDGQTIMFELLGDIYTMAISGGEATAVITGMAFDSQPVYSPNGKKIAFLSDRDGSENLYISDLDGENAKKLSKLNAGGALSPEWSADGNYLYVSQMPKGLGVYELWMYHKDGGSGIQITNSKPMGASTPRNRQPNAQGAAPSPNGRYIYYAGKMGGFSYNAQYPMWRVMRRDMVEGTTDTIATAYGSAIRPIISPDGKTMVYGTRYETETGLKIRNLETGEDNWLAYPVTHDDQESRATRDLLPSYTFTPDGKSVIANIDGKIKSIDVASGNITNIPFNAKVEQALGPNLVHQTKDAEGPVVARIVQTPSLSPDGNYVAFSALSNLYTMELKDGATPKKITRAGNQAFMPSWSPDGKWMTYVTWDASGGHIWKMRTNGRGRPQQLTTIKGYYTDPHFTPDGSQVVAMRASQYEYLNTGQSVQEDLVKLDAKGGDATVIYPGTGIGGIHFSKEADRVYLYSRAGIISMRLDGSDRRSHLSVKGNGFYSATKPVPARDAKISPDGKWALAQANQQLWLIAVPTVGKKAIEVVVMSPKVPTKQLTKIGADYFSWSSDGSEMIWSVGSTIFRQSIADVEWEKPKEDEKADDKDDAKKTDEADEGEKAEKDEDKFTTYKARVEVPRDNPGGIVVLRGATVITMAEAGVLQNADVVIEGTKIVAVGRTGSVEIPAGANIRDVSGKFITPGFVDSHSHWRAWATNGVIDTNNWPHLANLAYGVTAGLDVQTSTVDQFIYQDMFDAGLATGLRAWSTGPGVFSDNAFKTKEQAVNVLTRYKDHYRTKNIKAYVSGNRKQRQLIIQASKELGIMPTTEGALDLKLDLTHIIDGMAGNEHALPIFPIYKDVIQLTAQSGIGYTPTLLVAYGGPWGENYFYTRQNPHDDPKMNRFMPHQTLDGKTKRRNWFRDEEHVFPRLAEGALNIQRAGGRVGIGSHGQLQGLGYHWEMWSLAAGGGTPMEVLKAATIDGAHIIGHGDEVGSLEVGKFADMIILNKNPLDDIKNTTAISEVMMNGRIYNGDTLDQVYPVAKPLPPLWFWGEKPTDK
jgi:Tol biopolymer transport system component